MNIQPILNTKRKLEAFLKNKTVKHKNTGLCIGMNLTAIPKIYDIFASWEHTSGNLGYPVPNTLTEKEMESNMYGKRARIYKESEAKFAYYHLPLYEGKQLELRLSLAEHILKHINSVLAEAGTNENENGSGSTN